MLKSRLGRGELALVLACATAALPAGAQTGGSVLTTSLESVGTYNSNFYYQAGDRHAAEGWLVRPKAAFDSTGGRWQLESTARAEYGAFFNTPGTKDRYIDGMADVHLRYEGGLRHHFAITASDEVGHDPFGLDRTAGTLPLAGQQIDKWNQGYLETKYRYGAEGALLNLEFRAFGQERNYTDNIDSTRYLNFFHGGGEATLYGNISPKTALLLDLEEDDTAYSHDFPGQPTHDDTETHVRVGARWQALSRTSGEVRAGVVQRAYAAGGSSTELDWQAALHWAPRAGSTLTVNTERDTGASYLPNTQAINNQSYGLDYSQTLNFGLLARLSANAVHSSFIGSPRVDDYYTGGVLLEYAASRHLTVLGNVSKAVRTSSVPGLGFSTLGAFLGLRLSQ